MRRNLGKNNGFTTLAQFDQRLQATRADLHAAESKAEQSSQRVVNLNNEESAIYADLAALKLTVLDDAQSLTLSLSAAEREAQRLLQERERAIAALASQTEESANTQTQLEQDRQQIAASIEAVAQRLHQQVETTHDHLAQDGDYVAERDRAQTAIEQVEAASEKAARSNREHREKATEYENDTIFMYLWDRHYGTQDYRAGRMTRMFDDWVATHIDFEQSRRNYWMLREIPKRLDVHVKAMEKEANDLMDALQATEREAEIAGGVVEIEQELDGLEDQLEKFDQKIEAEEQQYADYLRRRDAFVAAEDEYYRNAIRVLSECFRAESVRVLQREARRTEGYEDDSLVGQLADLRREKDAVEQEQRVTQRSSAELTDRLHSLEKIRRQFKQRRFDAPNSYFNNADAIARAIDDFARGLISSRDLWRALERSQQFVQRRTYPNYRSSPGAMRFPRGVRIPGNWGSIGRGSGGGGFRMPSGGGGGGFKTGGGF